MSTENNQIKKDIIDLQIKKSIIEGDILYEKADIAEKEVKIQKYGSSWSYSNYCLKRIEVCKLKIDKLQLELEEINKNILTKDIIQ